MKLLFCGEKYCDKNPNWLTNSIHNVLNSFAQSFPSIPYHVLHYDEALLIYGNHIDNILPRYCQDHGIDTIIFTLLGGPSVLGDNTNPSLECLKTLKNRGIKLIYQWPDFGPGFGGESSKYLDSQGVADYHIIWDNGFSEYHLNYPLTEKHLKLWVPQDNKMFCKPADKPKIPVSFLGSARYPDRAYYISYLIQSFPEFVIRGGQREEGLGAYDYADFIKNSKISVNFAASPAGFWQTKGRVFEVLACGSLLFETRNPATASLFTPGLDYIEFGSPQDLIDKALYYLNNEDERIRISEHGHQTYLSKYTAKHYWDNIINTCIK